MRTSTPRIRSIIAATLTVMILAAFAALLTVPSGTEAQTPRNNPPTFTEGDSTTRAFNETLGDAAITTASDIGRAVDATDPNTGTTLEYSLEGTDAPKFGIISTSGQIQTKVGERYDHEAKPSYTVTVRVVDGDGSPDKITVTLNVTDQIEAPLTPLAPIPLAPPASTSSLGVYWTPPTNTGRPGITSYDLRYKVQGASGWTNSPQDVTATSDTIRSLTPGTPYRVQVRATNADGDSSWSQSGTETTTTIGEVPADWSLVPAGLVGGDQFRLLFLSSTTRDVTSTDIETYNTFVKNRAAAGHADIQPYKTGFRVVGCTEDIDARDNTDTRYTNADKGVPIYWLGGAKVADQYQDFYDGDWDDEAHDKNESGAKGPEISILQNQPATGCNHNGTETKSVDGSFALGKGTVTTGKPTGSGTFDGPISSSYHVPSYQSRPFYGLSEVFQVAVTKVPADWSLVPTGLIGGDQFRLLFLSSTTRTATPSDIDTYNKFVKDRAAAGHADIRPYKTGFSVVGCTPAVDARDNTDTRYTNADKGVPIYWLGGNKVADDYEDFYDGDWDDEAHDKDESGNDGPNTSQSANYPFTGCDHDGTEIVITGTSNALGRTNVRVGQPNSSVSNAGPISSDTISASSSTRPMYGLSEVYQVVELVTIQDATATEGSPVEFQVTLSAASTETVAVQYSTSIEADDTATNDPTAVGGSDFLITSDAIAIPRGETSGVISIATNDDTADEADQETFTLTLSNPTKAGLGAPSSAKGTIADNDDPPPTVEVVEGWSLIPAGLTVGDQFRLLFLSSTTRDATPTNIADYNAFIQGVAATGHADIGAYKPGFKVVACTEAVDARDNTGTTYASTNKGVPIYWLGGNKVADDYEDFYDGDWDDEANDKDESGNDGPDTAQSDNYPFTGCDHDGTEIFGNTGSEALGHTNFVHLGRPGSSTSGYGPISGNIITFPTDTRPLYGLSKVFYVVRDTTPVKVIEGWSLIPAGLGVDDQFRLLFLSSTTRQAISTAMADYNAFIQGVAAGGHADIGAYSSGFRAVGCTEAVDARDNTGTTYASTNKGVPIYWLGGNKVADDYADFYDGDWDDEVNGRNESGNDGPDTAQSDNYPFTGCDHDGTEMFLSSASEALGHTISVRVGRPGSSASGSGPINGSTPSFPTETRPMYGLSGLFQVEASGTTDATLSGLALEDDDGNTITLDPTFESHTINYTASVANSTDSVTLTATKNDANATVAITRDDDTSTPDNAVLALVVPSNTLTVTVTAVNTTTTLTYTVNVTRTDVLVSNTGQPYERSDSDNIQAQSFVTGSRAGGYTISEVDLLLWHVSGRNTSVSIRESNSSNRPSTLVATLTNPGTLTYDSINTFTAPTGTMLAAGRTYWITVNEGINTNRVGFRRTLETGKTGEADWSIGTRLYKVADGDDWGPVGSAILLFAIKAPPDSTTASTDATLRSLALEDADDNTVTLNPTFASNTITYTASVANSDNAVALSAETNDSNATVAITNDDDTNTPNDATLDLIAGSNTLTVTVTAEDSTTTETYTVTVTRELHTVTIAAQYPSVGAGIEDLVFMLTRTSAPMHELDVTVTIGQEQLWLDSSDLSHTVTFMAGSATATLTLDATSISLMPNAIGNLTATAEGTNITGDSDTVEMISIATPPITVSYDNSRYTFAENAARDDVKIYALATLDPIYPRAPSRSFSVRFSTQSASANDVEDFAPIDWQAIFVNADYESDGDKFIASKRLQDNNGDYFAVVNDDVYEGSPELLNLQIQRFTNLTPDDLVRFAYPDGTTCVQPCSDHEVSITDSGDQPVLSLNANPTSISEEDDSMTPGVAENVSILTVSAASPKTFSSDKTIKLVFTGTATYGTRYTVSPADTDSNATGHQVTLPALSPSVQVTITAAANDTADGNKGITVTGSLGSRVFGSKNIGLPDDDLARTTDIQRVNSNGTSNDNTTVAGLFKVRIRFIPSATGLLEEELEVEGGTIDQFVSDDISGDNVWYVDILPDQEATSVTVRVPPNVVDDGNPAAEVIYSAVPPLTPVFTTTANEPVIAQFMVTVTFSAAVTELPGNTEGDTTWYFSPAEDLVISHGDFVRYERDSGMVWNIFVEPDDSPGTTTITLPHQRVATGRNTDVWNAEASIEVQAGKRSVDFELDTYTVDEGSNITVKVTLDADPLNTVEIPLTAEGQGDTSEADYSGVPASLTFNTGETEKTFTFSATEHNSAVDGKSVKIAIGTPLPDIIKPGTNVETTVTITNSVTDLNEAPLAPDAPTVSATSGSTTSLDVSWTAPTNTGRPSIDSYDLRYRVGDTGAWTKRPQNVVSTNTSIDNLASDTSYQVQVRARNRDGNSPWSTSQTGTTGTTEENVLVSNTGQTVDGIGDPASFGAQSFSTGASNGGYTISEVRIRLNHVSPGATTLVSIREDNNGEPGDPVAILTNPASLTSDSVNTFTATAGTRLDPNTTYWITTNEGIVPTAFFALTVSYDETADAGWSIGNTRLYRFRETSTMIDRSSWIIGSKLLMIAIKGTAVGGASSDATLRGLRVNDGTNNLTLTPPFATGTVDYTASVANAVTTVTLTATVNHAAASVSAVALNGTTITDRNLTDGTTVPSLRVGSNEIVVTVTAENRTTRTYTVSVTREAAIGTPGVTVSKTALAVTEQDTTGNIYTLVLDSQPTASVTVTVSGHSGTDVTPSPAILTFTTNNWNVTQTVTVTAVDDADATSDTLTLTHSATSTDRNYNRITIAGVTVTVMDNDTENLLVNTPTLTVVEENSGTFTVKLATLPSANVTVSVSSSDTRAATVFPASLTFTTTNWTVTQTVTVSAVNDSDTAPETVTVTLRASGGGYTGKTDSVSVSVTDSDTANSAPTFTEGSSTSRAFSETLSDATVATASDIGAVVSATDTDTSDTLEYRLEGTEATKFGIISTSGQLRTNVGEKYDHEAKPSYAVTVRVMDGNGGSDTITVTLNVTDRNEAPLAPDAPQVSATSGSTTSLDVSWTAPTNTGRPGIDSYDLQYRVGNSGSFTNGPQDVTRTSAAIGNLAPNTSYQVHVRATNDEGNSRWSQNGDGTTNDLTRDPATDVPSAPTGLTARTSGRTQIDLSWDTPASDGGTPITGYRIEVSSDGGSNWSDLVANTGNANRTYPHTGLTTGDTRHYRVSAVNANGTGPASSVATAQTTRRVRPSTMNLYFTESYGGRNESAEITHDANSIIGDCSGKKYFRAYWNGPSYPAADRWEVRAIPHDGGSVSQIQVRYRNDDPEWPEFIGKARFSAGQGDSSSISFAVRGRYGKQWSAWGPTSVLHCRHTHE